MKQRTGSDNKGSKFCLLNKSRVWLYEQKNLFIAEHELEMSNCSKHCSKIISYLAQIMPQHNEEMQKYTNQKK